jgi:hypothetical protein
MTSHSHAEIPREVYVDSSEYLGMTTIASRNARSINQSGGIDCATREASCQKGDSNEDYFLRWRIFARMRRFLRPCFRRPFPDLFVPKAISVFKMNQPNKLATILDCSVDSCGKARPRVRSVGVSLRETHFPLAEREEYTLFANGYY